MHTYSCTHLQPQKLHKQSRPVSADISITVVTAAVTTPAEHESLDKTINLFLNSKITNIQILTLIFYGSMSYWCLKMCSHMAELFYQQLV
jgi:hypothetical protein